jgi:hypothetical protein
MSSVFKERIGEFKIKIKHDGDCCWNPRTDCDNFGTMLCAHGRYNLGDKQFRTSEQIEDELAENNAVVKLPLYLYDHSGITMNTTGFSCPWDSGQVGIIYVDKKGILEATGGKILTKKRLEHAKRLLQGEVETYDQYLRGKVYGFVVKRKVEGEWEEVDSCWGFYGDYEEGALAEARSIVKHLMGKETVKEVV